MLFKVPLDNWLYKKAIGNEFSRFYVDYLINLILFLFSNFW